MIRYLIAALVTTICLPASPFAHAREWKDASGKYTITAELIARDETMVVLEKKNTDLIAVEIAKLSKRDIAFLEEKEKSGDDDTAMQDWTMRRGLKVRGAVVDFAQRDVVIQRRRGKVYVNDKRWDNLPGIYRKMIPQIVTQFDQVDFEKEKDFIEWVKDQRGVAKKYTCNGVLLELESGDLYAVPFFFFSESDLKILEPGWADWSKTKEDNELREQQALSLRAQTMADRQKDAAQRQVAVLQLQLQGYNAGLFDLWEVSLMPPPNVRGMPLSVVVPARDSRQATARALAKNPNYRVGSVAKVSRKN